MRTDEKYLRTHLDAASGGEPDASQSAQKVDFETVANAANGVQLIWLPAIFTVIMLVAAISQLDPLLFILAGLGLVATFLGWCFAQAM